MKYTVDFRKEINLMLKNNIGLCPYFRRSAHLISHSRYIHNLSKNGMFYLRNLLNDETSFENPLFHLLFRAFVYAEIRFINNFIPQDSHEERLTSHLISEILSSLNIINETFKKKSLELYNSELNLEFHYTDLAAKRQEKSTGADFGLIFRINLPDYQETINVAKIQAKKLDKSATINLKQLKKLRRIKGKKTAGEFGYYCFYDMNTNKNEQNSPLIQRADAIISILDINKANSDTKLLQRNEITDPANGGVPLSVFLILDMLDTENENTISFTNISQAKKFIEDPKQKVARLLTISIGENSSIDNNKETNNENTNR